MVKVLAKLALSMPRKLLLVMPSWLSFSTTFFLHFQYFLLPPPFSPCKCLSILILSTNFS